VKQESDMLWVSGSLSIHDCSCSNLWHGHYILCQGELQRCGTIHGTFPSTAVELLSLKCEIISLF